MLCASITTSMIVVLWERIGDMKWMTPQTEHNHAVMHVRVQNTREAHLVKDIDKLEMIIQVRISALNALFGCIACHGNTFYPSN